MINWKVRINNKLFWTSIIPAILLVIQAVASCFGYTMDLGDLGNKLIDVVNGVFVVLSLLGIVIDPTTSGVADSTRAMKYKEPK